MIKVESVTKTFGNFTALDSMSLNVEKGSVYGLIGPNGAGKTTFIKTLMGIYKQDSGSIEVDGKKVYENSDIKKRMVYVSDDLFFYTTYSIMDVAKYYAQQYPQFSWEVFNKLSEIFKIDVKRKAKRLSKGMQKQVAFWIGISARPDIMILDEPLDGLDPVMRRHTWNILLGEVSERGMTVLVSSHNLRELEDVCDHIGIMFDGKVVIEKSLDDVKGNIHKVQAAFSEGAIPEELREKLDILHSSKFGSVENLIVRGENNEISKLISEYKPLIFDILPLTLEEIFIYELGGMDYEFKNIIL